MTRAEEVKALTERHGLSAKKAKKLAQRKPNKTNRVGNEAEVETMPRTKPDTTAVIAHEVAMNAPENRAERAELGERRVRGSQ